MANRPLTPLQIKALNRGVGHLIKAFNILGNVKVAGWQPHVLLYEVSDELLNAMLSLAEVAPNDLAPTHRVQITAETGGKK